VHSRAYLGNTVTKDTHEGSGVRHICQGISLWKCLFMNCWIKYDSTLLLQIYFTPISQKCSFSNPEILFSITHGMDVLYSQKFYTILGIS